MSGVEQSLFAGVLVFCRIGACLMTLPGFSSQRIAMRLRLFLAIAASLLIAPLAREAVAPALTPHVSGQALAILRETATGATIGLVARFYILAFEMMASAMSTAIGLSAAFAPPVEGDHMAPAFAGVMTLVATMVFFAAGLDALAIRALVGSYVAFPPGAPFAAAVSLRLVLDTLQEASLVCLQLAAPILALSLAGNVVFGLLSRFMPQAPIYFVSTPLLIGVGLLLVFLAERPMYELFVAAMARRIGAL